jgi:hypothetical protein
MKLFMNIPKKASTKEVSSTIKGQVPALPAPQLQLAIMPPNSAVVPSTYRVSNIIDLLTYFPISIHYL